MSKKSHLPRKTHVSKKWPAISGLDAHPNLPVGSPGNVVDPLDSIAEYGTDALRYALLTSSVGKSQSERFGFFGSHEDGHHSHASWWFQLFFYFHPYLGKIPNLTNIFQKG